VEYSLFQSDPVMHLFTRQSLFAVLSTFFCCMVIGEEPAPETKRAEPERPTAAYTDADAAKHVGEEATVTGKVLSIGTSKQGNVYINFGDAFPRQTFSGVIRAKDLQKVGDPKKFDGHAVAVTGKIELYNGKPQIVITAPAQIKVVEKTGSGEAPGKQ